MNVGIPGILVKTGKYMPGYENVEPPPTYVAENFDEAVKWIINRNNSS